MNVSEDKNSQSKICNLNQLHSYIETSVLLLSSSHVFTNYQPESTNLFDKLDLYVVEIFKWDQNREKNIVTVFILTKKIFFAAL